jgi:hypothetical protein
MRGSLLGRRVIRRHAFRMIMPAQANASAHARVARYGAFERAASHSRTPAVMTLISLVIPLTPDLALQRKPTVGDGDFDPFGGNRGVRDQFLQRGTAHLVVLPAIPGVNPELVLDGHHALHGARDLHGRPTLTAASNAASQRYCAMSL